MGEKRKIWFRRGSVAAKIAWIHETDQGLYLGPSSGLAGVHFSYHQDGKRHLTTGPVNHFTTSKPYDRPLLRVENHANVGGFGVAHSDLRWIERSSFRKSDLPVDFDEAIRTDLSFMVTLHLCVSEQVDSFLASIRSLGDTCKDSSTTFDLAHFPHMKGVVQLQYHTRPIQPPQPTTDSGAVSRG